MDTLSVNFIQKTDNIVLHAERGNKKVEFSLTLAELTQDEILEIKGKVGINFIPIHVVVTEWKKKMAVISFLNAKSKISVIVTRGPKAYKWNQVDVRMLVLKSGKRIHLIVTRSNQARGYDRRKGKRHAINRVMRVYQGEGSKLVTITDMSYTGVKFDEPQLNMFDSAQPVTLELTHPTTAKVIANIPMAIVRRIQHEDGTVTTGCKTTSEYYLPMTRYISNHVVENVETEEKKIVFNDSSKNWAFIAAAKMQESIRDDLK